MVQKARKQAAGARSRPVKVLGPAAQPREGAAPPQSRLQDVLPQINELAQRVGGMRQLADIVNALQQAKE